MYLYVYFSSRVLCSEEWRCIYLQDGIVKCNRERAVNFNLDAVQAYIKTWPHGRDEIFKGFLLLPRDSNVVLRRGRVSTGAEDCWTKSRKEEGGELAGTCFPKHFPKSSVSLRQSW